MQLYEAIKQFSEWKKMSVREGTVWGYDRDLRFFCLYLHNPPVETITIHDVTQYMNEMRALGWDPNTFIPKCMALRKFFQFCRLQGMEVINEQLIPIPRKRPKQPRVATEEDFAAILSVLPNDYFGRRDEAIIRLLWDTGARNREICDIDVQNVTEKQATITTKKAVTVPFRRIFWTKQTQEALNLWITERSKLEQKTPFYDPEALFVSLGVKHYGRRMSYRNVSQMFLKYSRWAGLAEHVNPHSFRHHMGHKLASQGANNSVIASILGHSNIVSTLTYTQMHGKELENQYRQYNG